MVMSAPPGPIITLLTDFSTRDPFVGVMKGVVLARFADARIVDLTHEVPAQDIAFAAFWLERSLRWFPPGSVHVVVVDPGVGTDRRALVARAGDQYLVGPDNGVLAEALERARDAEVFALDAGKLGLVTHGRTFHGRDVFAPVAAELAAGRYALSDLGSSIADFSPSPLPRPRAKPGAVEGEVVVVDRFGNLMTNIEAELVSRVSRPRVEIAGEALALVGTYADIGPGQVAALIDSFDVLEIAERDGSASRRLRAQRGARVLVLSS